MKCFIGIDLGSTTTKAVFIEKVGQHWRQTWRGEAPTTVEAPFEDVTRGVLNAAQEVAELSGRTLVQPGGTGILTPQHRDDHGLTERPPARPAARGTR